MFINNWIENFILAWKKRDIETIMNIFSSVEEYWETPFFKLSKGPENIKNAWEEIMYQDNIILNISVLISKENDYILQWYLKYIDSRDKQEYEMDGIYQLKFNDLKKCTFFKQWWVMNQKEN